MTVKETKPDLSRFHGLEQWNLFYPSLDLCLKAYQEDNKTESRAGSIIKGTKSSSRKFSEWVEILQKIK